MKLISLWYQDPSNSLQTYDFSFDNDREEMEVLEPLCFVGLNGSGKSKLLEILAKIFFEMDLLWRSTSKKLPVQRSSFKLEYKLSNERAIRNIVVIGSPGGTIQVFADGRTVDRKDIALTLPSNIIGYSSGDNETISDLFYDLREREFKKVRTLIDAGEAANREQSHTLFLDRNTTKLLLITSFMFPAVSKPSKFSSGMPFARLLKLFSEFINLDELLSFQIKFDTDANRILLSQRMEVTLQKLRRCALMVRNLNADDEVSCELDFFVCSKSKGAFLHEFGSAKEFFSRLYELSSLNLVSSTKSKIHTTFSINESELRVLVNSPLAEIKYIDLSDGEHQFIQIFSALLLFSGKDSIFLLDEPESHFNPAWRAKFVLILDELLDSTQKSSEFLISTHSPYVVSACKSNNVTIFKREGGKIRCKPPMRETYGGTFDFLLKELFEIVSPISDQSKKSIEEILARKNINEMKHALAMFAESPYKRDLYEAILRSGGVLDKEERG